MSEHHGSIRSDERTYVTIAETRVMNRTGIAGGHFV
jgi:hypothetical protein